MPVGLDPLGRRRRGRHLPSRNEPEHRDPKRGDDRRQRAVGEQAGEDLADSVFVVTGDGTDQIGQAVASATELILSGKADGQEAYDAFVKNATDLLGPTLVKE